MSITRRTLSLSAVALAIALPFQAAQATSGEWNKLIVPAELQQLQAAGDPLVIDIRPAVTKKADDPPSYATGHIPGAVSAPYGKWRGPKSNPGQPMTDESLTQLLQSIGAQKDRPTIVVHQGRDGSDFGAAARVYWTLKSAGVSHIAILNGGLSGWTAAKLPVSKEQVVPKRSTITASLSGEWMASREEIEAAIDGQGPVLLDARPIRQHLGMGKHKAAKLPGTLPGSQRFSQAEWFDPGSPMMSTPETASAIASAAGIGDDPTVSFCNTGHWAATNWFALSELAGKENVKLYPGSMVDWSNAGGAMANTGAE